MKSWIVNTTVTMISSAMRPRTVKPIISAIVVKIDVNIVKDGNTNIHMSQNFERVNLEEC